MLQAGNGQEDMAGGDDLGVAVLTPQGSAGQRAPEVGVRRGASTRSALDWRSQNTRSKTRWPPGSRTSMVARTRSSGTGWCSSWGAPVGWIETLAGSWARKVSGRSDNALGVIGARARYRHRDMMTVMDPTTTVATTRASSARFTGSTKLSGAQQSQLFERMKKAAGLEKSSRVKMNIKQQGMDRARKEFRLREERPAQIGDALLRESFSTKQSNGKSQTGPDNILKIDSVADALKGPGGEAVVPFRDGTKYMRLIAAKDAFLPLEAPDVELFFQAEKPVCTGLSKSKSEAKFLNLLSETGVLDILSGVAEGQETIDRTTGRTAAVDPSGHGTYVVGGVEMSLEGIICEVDRSVLVGRDLVLTECKSEPSSVINKRQILLPVIAARLTPDPPERVVVNVVQSLGSFFQDEGGFTFADKVELLFFQVDVPSNSADDISVINSCKVTLVLHECVDDTVVGLGDPVDQIDRLYSQGQEAGAQAVGKLFGQLQSNATTFAASTMESGEWYEIHEEKSEKRYESKHEAEEMLCEAWLRGDFDHLVVGVALDEDGSLCEHLFGLDVGEVIEYHKAYRAYRGFVLNEHDATELAMTTINPTQVTQLLALTS